MSEGRDFLTALNRNLTDSTALSSGLPANIRSAASVYSQSQVDSMLADIETSFEDYYTSAQTDMLLSAKAPTESPTFTGTVSGITKTMVGLWNVDNTSDALKPISTLTQSALDLKAPLASPTFTGTPAVPTAAQGTNTTQAASTAFVVAEIAASGGGAGDFAGPASSTSGNLVSFGDNTGKLGADSGYSASSFQAASSKLTDIAALTATDGNVIVGDGTTWVAESGATARTSLGLGTGNSPQFTAIELGNASDTTLTRSAAGRLAVEGNDVLLASVEDQTVTGGAAVTSKSLGTQSSGTLTLDMGDRPLQHYTNGGAHTLAPGSVNGSALIDITNNGSAGAITTSGFTKVAGDSFTTTNGNKFRCHVSVGNGGSLLVVQALQ